jgi:hypothetical protein
MRRGRETESGKSDLRVRTNGERARSTRRERFRSERETTCFEAPSRRATGGHGRRGDRVETERAPQLRTRTKSGGVRRWHGLPGQRERRRGVDGAGQPADRGSISEVEVGQPTEATGRHLHRETGVTPRSNGGRSADRPGFDSGNGKLGNQPTGSGRSSSPGNRWERSNGSGSGNRATAENGHRPPKPLGVHDGRCD